MKILLAEDEPAVAGMMHKGLSEKGYEVSVAQDGHTALAMAMEHPFRLMILDIMLPGINGLEVCRQLRKNKVPVPVLMLTALGTTENIVAGLDSGADDYLTKPFRFAELEARIRSLLRRGLYGEELTEKLTINGLEMDIDAKTVKREGQEISLTATEFRLLECFMRSQNKVLSRVELLEKVWGVDFNMATNVVDVYVNYLRKKVDKDFDSKLIHTVVGMGYVMREG
ncbi:response regulator transcription factor [Foetidibacter luteolus]|uniref:response regulator transcription factor n=1 Tax=Foetidibacter luteolus TaxID=2608880 RepID=UPI00129ABD2E|nr:response regulator transcription factor [Foetidibacter luteolus]